MYKYFGTYNKCCTFVVQKTSKMTLQDFIIDKEKNEVELSKIILQGKISELKDRIEKLYNTSVTPFSDSLARSFPMGVGYMNGRGAKRKESEFLKEIEKSKKITLMESELKHYESKLYLLNKGKIIRPNGLSVVTYKCLIEIIPYYISAIKDRKLKGKELSPE